MNIDRYTNFIKKLERDLFEIFVLVRWHDTEVHIILFDADSFFDLLDKINSYRKEGRLEHKESLEKIKQIRSQRD